ncbi:type II toxin-antitoxin system HipA family toxin [Schaalia odontolytica]
MKGTEMSRYFPEAEFCVRLHGIEVGTISCYASKSSFRFSDQYYWRADRPVLGFWFENGMRRETSVKGQSVLPLWFSNLLPEGLLRTLVCSQHQLSEEDEPGILCALGDDLPGAVTVSRVESPNGGAEDEASLPKEGLSYPSDSLIRASVAGNVLKFSMRSHDQRLTIPGRRELGDHIVKLPPPGEYDALVHNEFYVMSLAQACGIEVPDFDVVPRENVEIAPSNWVTSEEYAFSIARFDRNSDGRVHMEDFCQAGNLPGRERFKYSSSLEYVMKVAYRNYDLPSLVGCVRRTVFNMLCGNDDAHLKNWSLLYPDSRNGVLSPAYDLVCTAVYFDRPQDMALKLCGTDVSADIRLDDFLSIAEACDVERDVIEDAVHSMIAAYGESLDRVEMPTRLTSIQVRGKSIDLRPWLRERYQRLSVSLLS